MDKQRDKELPPIKIQNPKCKSNCFVTHQRKPKGVKYIIPKTKVGENSNIYEPNLLYRIYERLITADLPGRHVQSFPNG